jgi:hypothetical protein|tara:strand:+ start:271 stop:552 length:282 start_codon:yes stop_codon:yes gene_type:complete
MVNQVDLEVVVDQVTVAQYQTLIFMEQVEQEILLLYLLLKVTLEEMVVRQITMVVVEVVVQLLLEDLLFLVVDQVLVEMVHPIQLIHVELRFQ